MMDTEKYGGMDVGTRLIASQGGGRGLPASRGAALILGITELPGDWPVGLPRSTPWTRSIWGAKRACRWGGMGVGK